MRDFLLQKRKAFETYVQDKSYQLQGGASPREGGTVPTQ